jgi:hypothetical protein
MLFYKTKASPVQSSGMYETERRAHDQTGNTYEKVILNRTGFAGGRVA